MVSIQTRLRRALSSDGGARFIGVDLGWYGKPSGLASIHVNPPPRLRETRLSLLNTGRLQSLDEILAWIAAEAGTGCSVVAVDAPLVICNSSGIRPAESELNRDFRRFHAGCHAANLARPFACNVLSFSRRLETLGFRHGPNILGREPGRFQIEVHPHAAAVNLFGLDRIVKYKRGPRAARAAELRRLRALMLSRLPLMEPPLDLRLPSVPLRGDLKPVEDRIDAVLCAFIAAHWWFWSSKRNRVYGDEQSGYIIVPNGPPARQASAPAVCRRASVT